MLVARYVNLSAHQTWQQKIAGGEELLVHLVQFFRLLMKWFYRQANIYRVHRLFIIEIHG